VVVDPLIGVLLDGRYRVLNKIGQGGMGVVYRGIQESLNREVAIKVFLPREEGGVDLQRFLREARHIARVDHPSVVRVYDYGRIAGDQHERAYLVMEFLEGINLADVLMKRGALTTPEVIQMVGQLAGALDALHTCGVVHRDFKPENVVVVLGPTGKPTAKLIDFGLSHACGNSRLTQHGLLVGTPDYIAPEACGGTLPDHRADLYALAVLAFEALSGGLPFVGDDPMEILVTKLCAAPRTLSTASGRFFVPAVEDVLARGLARDPVLRYERASHFVQALVAALRVQDHAAA
jgi:serine/threonine-protein kinase